MKNQELEQLLATEMENVHGGAQNQDTCVCERGGADRKSTRLNSSHSQQSRMPSSA